MKGLWALLAVVVVACMVPQTGSLAADIRQERVSFKAGASAATLKGTIKGEEIIDYVLGAKAGQTMSVTLKTSSNSNAFNVLPPGSTAAIGRGEESGNSWTGTLPVDGDYVVRVFLVRAAARRHESATYTLTVGISGAPASAAPAAGGIGTAPASDAKVPGTPYHATGTVPCSVGPDPKGSAQCSFGVIRGAPGNAEVRLAAPGFDVKLHKDHIETVLIFTGDTVKSSDPNTKVTAEKQGDTWSIGVNDFDFYSIPEVVIVGD